MPTVGMKAGFTPVEQTAMGDWQSGDGGGSSTSLRYAAGKEGFSEIAKKKWMEIFRQLLKGKVEMWHHPSAQEYKELYDDEEVGEPPPRDDG